MISCSSLPNVLDNSLKEDDSSIYSEIQSSSSSENEEKQVLLPSSTLSRKQSCYLPARFVLAFWSCLGFVCMFALRMDLSLAILDMVKSGNNSDGVRSNNSNDTNDKFNWSDNQQYILLSSFYYGYTSTQILGGYLAGRFGGKLVFGASSAVSSLLGLVSPCAALDSYNLLIVCRVGQGLAQGLAQPCMHTMWSKWAPENERSTLMTFTYAGCQLGNIIATVASGYLSSMHVLGGWPLEFYLYSWAGIIWSFLWFFFVHESPKDHPRISDHERMYIQKSTECKLIEQQTRTAWGKVLRSPALLAIIAAQFANDWGCIALTTCLPKYLMSVLHFDLTQNGFLSSLPFMVILITNPVSGIIADVLRSRQILSTKNTRKLMNSLGLLVPAALILAVVFWNSSRLTVVALCTVAVGISGFTMAGYSVNHLDIAPEIAGILYGITNTIGTTVGFIGPVILSVLTVNENTTKEWNIYFYITSGIFFIGGIIYLIFAEGEPQNWTKPCTDICPENNNTINSDETDGKSRRNDHYIHLEY